jgi:hypothetical protein
MATAIRDRTSCTIFPSLRNRMCKEVVLVLPMRIAPAGAFIEFYIADANGTKENYLFSAVEGRAFDTVPELILTPTCNIWNVHRSKNRIYYSNRIFAHTGNGRKSDHRGSH